MMIGRAQRKGIDEYAAGDQHEEANGLSQAYYEDSCEANVE